MLRLLYPANTMGLQEYLDDDARSRMFKKFQLMIREILDPSDRIVNPLDTIGILAIDLTDDEIDCVCRKFHEQFGRELEWDTDNGKPAFRSP